MRNWLIATVICAIAIVACIKFVDAPMARFVQTLSWSGTLHVPALGIPILIVCSGILLLLVAAERGLGISIGVWGETFLLTSLSLTWGVCVTELALKPFFGRQIPSVFLSGGPFGFDWLQGTPTSSFPSGHAVQIMSVAAALWLRHPQMRIYTAVPAGALLMMLVLGNWHFVSDVIAGGYVGALGAAAIVMLWQTRPPFEAS